MKISVTEADIAQGKKSHISCCPVALALSRKISQVTVGSKDIDFKWRGKKHWNDPLPAKVIKFIKQFDNGKPVKPFTFTLPLR